MDNFITHFYIIIFFATTTTFIIFSDGSVQFQSGEKIPLFVFGDSYFDAGNNNYINTSNGYRANFYPYGETFFKYATGRFSDGRLIPDFIAEFAKLPLIPPYWENGDHNNWVYGVNFGSSGGGALVETNARKAIDLITQLSYFKNVDKELRLKLGNNDATHLLSNSVYLFSIGTNDLLSPSSNFISYSQEEYVTIVIGNVTRVIMELYNKGARKFGFMSLLPLGCLPYARAKTGVNGECEEKLTSSTKLYNGALAKKLQDLEKELNGFRYSNFDSFTVAMDMIDNPSEYGFEEVKSACCGSGKFNGLYSCGGKRGNMTTYELCKDPETHLFFDPYHPTEKCHRILAELMWHGIPNITRPLNLKSLFNLTSYQGEEVMVPTSTSSTKYLKKV